MELEIESALRQKAVAAGLLSADLLALYPEVGNLKDVDAAVAAFKEAHPNLHRETDFGKMDSDRFKEAESTMLQAGRVGSSTDADKEFSGLDFAQLEPDEQKAFDNWLNNGKGKSAVDRSVLNRALIRQKAGA